MVCKMKATLQFNLPEDRIEYQIANASNDLYCVLWDTRESLIKLRNGHDSLDDALTPLIENMSEVLDKVDAT